MNNLNQKQSIYLLIFLLAVALVWNLGMTPILADEPTRTIVAQELDYNNNLIVPTINGEYYYNKPPIYNWIILGLYKITGSKDEIVSRAPVVLSIFLFIVTIFYWCKKYMSKENSILIGLVFATGSRLLFYDSMLGLIDVFFSLLIFITFILVYELEKKKLYTFLFTTTYILIAVCFLMKGLQAIAFQGMTLLGWFIYKKQFRQLFKPPHFIGLAVFTSIVGYYLYLYDQYNPLDILIKTLWTESSKRTVGGQAWYHDVVHLITFPFKTVLADMFPWGILLLFLFDNEIRNNVFKNELSKFVLIMFSANIIVYWLSPETRGRYLYPHYALLSIICIDILSNLKINESTYLRIKKVSGTTFFIIIGLAIITFFGTLIINETNYYYNYSNDIEINLIIVVLITVVSYVIHKKLKPFFSIVLILIVIRSILDAVVLPYRKHFEPYYKYKNEAIRIAKTYKDKPLFIYKRTPIDHSTSHYFLIDQERVVPHINEKIDSIDAYYLFQTYHLKDDSFEIIDSFPQNWENQTIYLGK